MKALLLIVVVIIVCIVLFVTGLVAPNRSRKMQRSVDRLARKGEIHGDQKAGKLGDLTQEGLRKARHAADASAEKGRDIHERVADGAGDTSERDRS